MIRSFLIIAGLLLLTGCDGRAAAEPKEKPDISQRVRVENLPIRVERSQRISETETVQVIIVPGFPYGKRCVVFTKNDSSAMQCEDVRPRQQ